MPDNPRVVLTRTPDASGWLASIDGGPQFPITDYALQNEGPQAMLSLVLPVDGVQVGDPSQGTTAPEVRPAVPPKNERAVWGSSAQDPRERIPGWSPDPSLGAQVAGNAERAALRPSVLDRMIRLNLIRNFGEGNGPMGVPA